MYPYGGVREEVVAPKILVCRQTDNYRWCDRAVTRNAPFATNDTPDSRVRIIGSRIMAIEDRPPNGVVGSPRGASSPRRLTPINGRHLASPVQRHVIYNTAEQPLPQQPFYAILPPIHQSHNDSGSALFPTAPDPTELLDLRQRVARDLSDTEISLLKNVYITLTNYDRQLTGYVNFSDLGAAFTHCRVPLSMATLRQLSCLFVSEFDSSLVNYEKVLSFIGSSIQDNNSNNNAHHQHHHQHQHQQQQQQQQQWILEQQHQEAENWRRKTDAEWLLRTVESQLSVAADVGYHVDYQRIFNTFSQADHDHSFYCTQAQIKSLCEACKVPLTDRVIDLVLDRCDRNNGQYRWQQFVEFIGRALMNLSRHGSDSASNQRFDRPRNQQVSQLEHVIQEPSRGTSDNTWIKSFKDLSRALYRSDANSTGNASIVEASFLTKEYNSAFNLGLTETMIQSAVSQSRSSFSTVNTDQFLQALLSTYH